MDVGSFKTFIEDNSTEGSTLVFLDQYRPKEYHTDPGCHYSAKVEVIRKAVTIYILPDDVDSDVMGRDALLALLDDLERNYGSEARCQVVLFDGDIEHPRAYLADGMWGNVVSSRANYFEFTSPVDEDEIHKGILEKVFDRIDQGQLNGGC